MNKIKKVYSKKQCNLQVELVINNALYRKNIISKEKYLKIKQDILKDLGKYN